MRTYSLFFAMLLVSVGAMAQAFVKTIPKPRGGQGIAFLRADTVKNEIRPLVEISAYGFPGEILLTGAGFSYQHLKFINDRWRVRWSLSYMTWYDLKKVYSGLTFGVLNNLILVGIAAHSKEIIGTVGIGVNLNN